MNYDDEINSTLFIVDDNPENLRMAADILEGAGFIAVPIKSGMEALDLVKKRKPNLILLDIIMPGGIDGFETCRRLKNSRETWKIPIIFMSALTEPVDKVKGFNLGAVDFITKPVNNGELISRVSTHLKINRLQDELLNMNTLLEAKVAVRTEELLNSNRSLNLEIEERKQIENALRESEEKFRAISESANDGVLILDVSGIITFINNAAGRIFGYGKGEMLGLNISVLIITEESGADKPASLLKKSLRRNGINQAGSLMALARKKNGAIFPVDLSVSNIEIKKKRHLGILARDLTVRMEMEKRLDEVEEMEREKIAYDLHDGLGQHLTGIRYILGLLILKMKNESLPYIATAERVMELIDETKEITRNLSRGISFINIEKEGFIEAVKNMLSDIKNIFDISYEFTYNSGILNKAVSSHVYFIIKEIITNAISHSKAGNINISITRENNMININIIDDGKIYKEPAGGYKGKGLKIIKYRLLKINGTFNVTNPPEGGNLFSITVEDSDINKGA